MDHKFYPISKPDLSDLELEYIVDAVKSGWVSSLGPYIEQFERDFAKFCGTEFALTCSNGTTGIHLALMAARIGPGDEVIIPNLTFIATANAVIHAGATPVLADIDPETLNLCPKSVEKVTTSKTKAIMPVHLYGVPADMTQINLLAEKHNLVVFEDAAEAHGATHNSQRVGSMSKAGVFSFYGNKIITTGEGGMITSNDKSFVERAKQLRDHAMSKSKRYWHEEVGYNYRMTNIQAAMGVAQLQRVDELLHKRKQVGSWYTEMLQSIPQVKVARKAANSNKVDWMVCLEHEQLNDQNRVTFMSKLKDVGVDTRPYFYPISHMERYKEYKRTAMPVSESLYQKGINLPSSNDLTETDVLYICDQVRSTLKSMF